MATTSSIGAISAGVLQETPAHGIALNGRTRAAAAEKRPTESGRQADRAVSRSDAEAMTEEINDILGTMHNGIRFRLSDGGGEVIVQIVDPQTEEVIREVPSEDLVEIREKFDEALGIIFDKER